jgi:hypothetical protein
MRRVALDLDGDAANYRGHHRASVWAIVRTGTQHLGGSGLWQRRIGFYFCHIFIID